MLGKEQVYSFPEQQRDRSAVSRKFIRDVFFANLPIPKTFRGDL